MNELAKSTLADCERQIEQGIASIRQGFAQIVEGLQSIYQEQLYKTAGYANFQIYCDQHLSQTFGFGYKRAMQYIAAGETAHNISTIVEMTDLNESMMRTLHQITGQDERQKEIARIAMHMHVEYEMKLGPATAT
jgi:hypothetical protein